MSTQNKTGTTNMIKVKLEHLRYDYDPEVLGHYGYGGYNNLLLALEKSLPEIPENFKVSCEKLFPRILKVYESIKNEGIKNPLIVKKYSDTLYRVRVGNQRLAVLRALGIEEVDCIATSEDPMEFKKHYQFIEGCEE
jgi:hypothetical protein